MAERITDKDLEQLVKELNELTGNPVEPSYLDPELGHYRSNVGHYFIDRGYGGVRLGRITNLGGAMHAVLSNNYKPKRELWNTMRAFVQGIRYGRESALASEYLKLERKSD
jgi:hypothetical protein